MAEPIDRGLHEGLSGRRKGDVAGISDGTLARGIDLTGGRFCLCGIAPVDDDRTALSDEPGRDLLAHPRATAGDDGNLLLETHNFSPWLSYLPIDRSTQQIALELFGVKIYLSIERGGARQ